MYFGGTLFLGHATGHINIYNQVTLGASDTIRSKELYELQACERGGKVKKYHGDNGVFKAKALKDDMEKRH